MVVLSCETDFVAKNQEFKTMAYDIAMHIAALNPMYIKAEEVSEEAKTKASEAFASELAGKPAAMREKIMQGKLSAYFGERTLLEQQFIKNPELTIKDLIDSGVQKFGEKIEVTKFTRFSVLES